MTQKQALKYLLGINETALVMHSEIYELDNYLREESELAGQPQMRSVK